jgi:hypothetical protein
MTGHGDAESPCPLNLSGWLSSIRSYVILVFKKAILGMGFEIRPDRAGVMGSFLPRRYLRYLKFTLNFEVMRCSTQARHLVDVASFCF